MNTERKEILTVSGPMIMAVMIIVADLLVLGFGLWWHNMALFDAELDHNAAHTVAVKRIHDLKLEVISHDGVSAWGETGYAKQHPESVFDPEEDAAPALAEDPLF